MGKENLDAVFSALSDPTRRAMVERLRSGPASVLELAEPFDMSLPAVSKHLKVLEAARLIHKGRDAQRRPCQLRPETLKRVADWLEDYRHLWEGNIAYLGGLLDELDSQVNAKPD